MSDKLLIKIHDVTCEICKQLAGGDIEIAYEFGLEFKEIELGDLSAYPEGDPFKDYIVNMYVTPNDGMIDVPIYVIINDGAIQASGIVKSLQEITNLVQSWETWLKLQSSDSETE